MEPLRIVRLNRMLELEPLEHMKGFKLSLTEYTGHFTVTGGREIKVHLSTVQTDTIQMWELIDALTQPDVLHPIYRDIRISPFGDEGKLYLHVKWEAWHSDETLPELMDSDPDMRELYVSLSNLIDRAERIRKEIEEKIRNREQIADDTRFELVRKTLRIMADVLTEILPESPWRLRGLIGAPFRKLTLGKFNTDQYVSIRLSPSEARRLARMVKICSGHLIYF